MALWPEIKQYLVFRLIKLTQVPSVYLTHVTDIWYFIQSLFSKNYVASTQYHICKFKTPICQYSTKETLQNEKVIKTLKHIPYHHTMFENNSTLYVQISVGCNYNI